MLFVQVIERDKLRMTRWLELPWARVCDVCDILHQNCSGLFVCLFVCFYSSDALACSFLRHL